MREKGRLTHESHPRLSPQWCVAGAAAATLLFHATLGGKGRQRMQDRVLAGSYPRGGYATLVRRNGEKTFSFPAARFPAAAFLAPHRQPNSPIPAPARKN